MIKRLIVLFVFMVFFLSCKKAVIEDANMIVDKSIQVSGGEVLKKSVVKFEFRDRYYTANRLEGEFSLSRLTINTSDSILDIVNNQGFKRYINNDQIQLADSIASKHSASVNSVHYFSILPYGLHNKAVNKTYLGQEQVKGKDYYKIQVTFDQDGGGEDFEDVFVYWIDIKSFKVGYLAYSYNEAHGKGLRFREAYNERVIKGIRFVDYNNFKPKDNTVSLNNLAILFESGELQLLSKIELEYVSVDAL